MNANVLTAVGFWCLGIFDVVVVRFADIPVAGKWVFAALAVVSVVNFVRGAVRA
jgi:hypothetical protein